MYEANIKYDEDGAQVYVQEELKKGFLVNSVYESPEGEIFLGKKAFIVERVFDKPPTEKYSEEIVVLQGNIKELSTKVKSISHCIKETEVQWKETQKKCAAHPVLKDIFDFIEGKITHYVLVDYNMPQLVKREDAIAQDDGNRYNKVQKQRLLSLYGDSKGNLEWNISCYSDGSGSQKSCYPFTSYEKALEKYKELLLFGAENSKNWPRQDIIAGAKAHNIELPKEYVEGFYKRRRDELAHSIDKAKNDLKLYETQLAILS